MNFDFWMRRLYHSIALKTCALAVIMGAISLWFNVHDNPVPPETKKHEKCKKVRHFLMNAAHQFDTNVTQLQRVEGVHNRFDFVLKGHGADLDKLGSFVEGLARYDPGFMRVQSVDVRRAKTKPRFTIYLGVKKCL